MTGHIAPKECCEDCTLPIVDCIITDGYTRSMEYSISGAVESWINRWCWSAGEIQYTKIPITPANGVGTVVLDYSCYYSVSARNACGTEVHACNPGGCCQCEHFTRAFGLTFLWENINDDYAFTVEHYDTDGDLLMTENRSLVGTSLYNGSIFLQIDPHACSFNTPFCATFTGVIEETCTITVYKDYYYLDSFGGRVDIPAGTQQQIITTTDPTAYVTSYLDEAGCERVRVELEVGDCPFLRTVSGTCVVPQVSGARDPFTGTIIYDRTETVGTIPAWYGSTIFPDSYTSDLCGNLPVRINGAQEFYPDLSGENYVGFTLPRTGTLKVITHRLS